MGEPDIGLVHYNTGFHAAVEEVLHRNGLRFQTFNALLAETQRNLRHAQPTIVILDGSQEGLSQSLTVQQIFRLCPQSVVLQVWPDTEQVEVYRSPHVHMRHPGNLVSLVQELTALAGMEPHNATARPKTSK